jgi:hypothetical protein
MEAVKLTKKPYTSAELDLIFSVVPNQDNAKMLAKLTGHSADAIKAVWRWASQPAKTARRRMAAWRTGALAKRPQDDPYLAKIRAAARRKGWALP